jgi:putative GTP pyrophosphokinase
MEQLNNGKFDFELHQQNAITEFTKIKPLYDAFSIAIQAILKNCLTDKDIKYHSIETRVKSIVSFAKKASKVSQNNINEPKYNNPIKEITDLIGLRIITFFPITINKVDQVLSNEFDILEKSDKSDILDKQEKLGYKSVHYLIKFKQSRCNLSEYKMFNDMIAEVQVRTILQHAWAEIEHDIEYKSETIIPTDIKRRFMALAGLIEIADREFQSIQSDNEIIKEQSRISVNSGKLQNVEITKDSMRVYLNKKFREELEHEDDSSYDQAASMLIYIGFKDLQQVDDCIKNYYDSKEFNKFIWMKGQSQLRILDDLLLVGMGDAFIKRHPWTNPNYYNSHYWSKAFTQLLSLLRKTEITIGNYIPD